MITLNQPLPNWSIESIFGNEVPKISDFSGKPTLILIFSLGCPGCLGRAIPFANRMVFEYGENLNVIGIHSDFGKEGFTLEQFQKAKDDFYLRFDFFNDKNFDTTFLDYGAGGTPHWLLVDENGNLVYSIFGSDPNNALLRLDLKIKEVFQNENNDVI